MGTIDAGDLPGVARLLKLPILEPPSGSLDVVGRLCERTRSFDSGALVQNLGNDQWFVYLVNIEQLTKLVQSDYVALVPGESGRGDSLGKALLTIPGTELAIHLLGLGSGVAIAASLVEIAAVALTTLADSTIGRTSESRAIADDIYLHGGQPRSADVRRAMHREVSRASTGRGPSDDLEIAR